MPKISKGDGPTWEPAPGSEPDTETAEAQDGVGDAAPGDAPGEQQTTLVSEAGPEVTDLPPGTPGTPADTPPPPPPPGA